MVEILARLDRTTGMQVLCGMKNERGMHTCRGEVAHIEIVDGKRVLSMLDGWKQRGSPNHFTLNNHSVRLRKVAHVKVSRGDLAPDQFAGQGRPRTRREALGDWAIFPAKGIILADCPQCGHVNTLTGSALRVASR
ncbi:MAG TPA: hypothetical protein VIN65_02895 [Candidatus Dormibacteraeota bacterium]